MLSGNNGILTRATETKMETIAGQVQEEKDLWELTKLANSYTSKETESLDELLERLGPNNQKLLTAEQVEEIKTTGEVTIGSRTIVFGLENQFEIGDVVTAEGLEKFKESETTYIDWIYFGKDSNGKNLITTAKPLPISNEYTFTWNKQPDGATVNQKYENSAKNWLYYDLQEGQAGYNDKDSNDNDICTTENNINKFCANIYSKLYTEKGESVIGKARSITLEDINNVTGFKAPTFNKYNFGTTNDYTDESITGNHTVNFYYPTLSAKDQETNTSSNPKVYKYWKKATSASDTWNNVPCDVYYYYNNGDNYELYWEGTTRSWSEEPLSETSSWKLETPENMKYVTGENNELAYAVGSRSVDVKDRYAYFHVARVGLGFVYSYGITYFCRSHAGGTFSYGSGESVPVRPVVSLESGIKLNRVQ